MENNLFLKYKSIYDTYLESEDVSLTSFCKNNNTLYLKRKFDKFHEMATPSKLVEVKIN